MGTAAGAVSEGAVQAWLARIADATLPLSPWLVGALWLALFVATRRVTIRSRELLAAQPHVVVEGADALAALDRPPAAWSQFALLTAILVVSWLWSGAAALVYLVAAAVLAHSALLGGALFLALVAYDLSRRARTLAPRA